VFWCVSESAIGCLGSESLVEEDKYRVKLEISIFVEAEEVVA
jgi:hypothetical protein